MGAITVILIPQGSAIFVLLTFVLLMYLVKKIAWTPITKMMDTRADQINNDLDSAEKSRGKATELKENANKNLKKSRTQADKIIEDARKNSRDEAKDIIDSAQSQATSINKQAQIDAKQAKQDSLNTAKDQIGDIAISIASEILKREINKKDHERLINGFINKINHQTSEGNSKGKL